MAGIVAAASLGVAFAQRLPSAAPDSGLDSGPSRPTPTPAAILTVPPERMREVVENDSLLPPDRRFVLAFEELSRLCGGTGRASLKASRRRWSVDVGLSRPAELPGIPSFQDAVQELRAVAANPNAPKGGSPLPAADEARLRALAADAFADGPIRALEEIDRLWSAGSDRRVLLDLASLSYVTLEVQLYDSVEMGDLVAGRALALLALSDVTSDVGREERSTLLARAMGYESGGTSAGVSHPLTRNTRQDGPGAGVSPDPRYLDLLERASSMDVEKMKDLLRSLGATENAAGVNLLLRCRTGRLGEQAGLSSALIGVALADAGVSNPGADSAVVPAFERALASHPPSSGPFWDTKAREARLRALFYSGLADVGDFTLDQLSSGPAATGFAQLVTGAETGPGAELQLLYSHLAEVKSGQKPVASLVPDLAAFSGPELQRIVKDVLDARPDDSSAMKSVRLLCEHGFLDDAEAFLRSWLDRHANEDALTRALYASRLAHVLFLKGRFDEAWSEIAPFVQTWKGDALGAGAEALQGLGRTDEALKMAGDCVARYPDDPMARIGHSKILWRLGRHDEAARPLTDPRFPLSSESWRALVPREFVEVYRGRPAEEAVKAMDGLLRAGANAWFLFEVASRFERSGIPDTSIVLLDAIARAKNERIDGYLRSYRFRRRAHGAEVADRWFRENVVPSESASWIGKTAFAEREFDLLWLLPDDENHWFLRAQAAAFEGRPEGPRLESLRAHFRDPKTPRPAAVAGLYLLGELPEGDLLATATDATRRCEVAYLLGLKAAGEKRLEDASAWLRAAVRTGQTTAPSHGRARGMLERWDTRRFGVVGGADIR